MSIDPISIERVRSRKKGGLRTNMLARLKNIASQIDGIDLDEAISLVAFGKVLSAEYAEFEMETPEWLTEALTSLKREIGVRRLDAIEREIKDADSRLEALKSADEKRTDLRAKKDRLEALKAKIVK
jgi:hypothetical protein